MPVTHCRGDIGSRQGRHDPPVPATAGSSRDGVLEYRLLMRVDDSYTRHPFFAGHARPLGRALANGLAKVSVNGKPAGSKFGSIDCGGNARTSSSNVFLGKSGPGGLPGSPAFRKNATAGRSMPVGRG